MQTGLIAFDAVAKINGISIDLRSIIREYSISNDEIQTEELLRIMKQFDFKAKIKNISPEKFNNGYPLPAIILNSDNTYSVLLKINTETEHVLIYSVKENTTKELFNDSISRTKAQSILTGLTYDR